MSCTVIFCLVVYKQILSSMQWPWIGLLQHANDATYRNKIDGFSVVYQFHQDCDLSSDFRKNHESQSLKNPLCRYICLSIALLFTKLTYLI